MCQANLLNSNFAENFFHVCSCSTQHTLSTPLTVLCLLAAVFHQVQASRVTPIQVLQTSSKCIHVTSAAKAFVMLAQVANSWRTTADIAASWDSILRCLDNTVGLSRFAGPGAWNDPDMLEASCLCCVVLCCAVLCCAVPCRAVPCRAVPCLLDSEQAAANALCIYELRLAKPFGMCTCHVVTHSATPSFPFVDATSYTHVKSCPRRNEALNCNPSLPPPSPLTSSGHKGTELH